jgi:hypothetical protein
LPCQTPVSSNAIGTLLEESVGMVGGRASVSRAW